jgi:hypothetical protein
MAADYPWPDLWFPWLIQHLVDTGYEHGAHGTA